MSNTQYDQYPERPFPENKIVVGRIIGTWGLKGHLKVKPLTSNDTRFTPGRKLLVGLCLVEIMEVKQAGVNLRIRVDLVKDQTHAKSLVGTDLTVWESDVQPLPENTYYHFEIIGMEVRTEEGNVLGTIVGILPAGGTDVYVIRSETKRELLLPAIPNVVLCVDPDKNLMVVRPLEGM